MADTILYNWQVYNLSYYESFSMDYMADIDLSASLLIPLDNTHRNTTARSA
jgi:hypothetical protein